MHYFWASMDMGLDRKGMGGVGWVVLSNKEKKLNDINDCM